MRMVLALCAVVLCTCCGNAMAGALQERIALLQALEQDITAMRGWIAYGGYPLREVLSRLRGERTGMLWKQAYFCVRSAQPFAEGWRKSVNALRESDLAPLTPPEFEVLLEFGAGLGCVREPEQQIRHMEETLRRLRVFEEAAQQEAARKCRLYRSLGALGGLAVAIVIL